MGAYLATPVYPPTSASRPVGRFTPEEVAALVEEVRRRADLREQLPLLVRAIATGYKGAVQRYLREVDGARARDAAGRTPLHWAAGVGSERLVGALLAVGAGAGARDHRGATPLHHAARGRSAGVAAALLQAGACPGDRDCDGRTPLMRAAAQGHAPLCQLLADDARGPPLDTTDHFKQTALHLAAGAGRVAAVRALVARGASVNAADDEERVPLHCAMLFYQQAREAAMVARYYPESRHSRGVGDGGDPAEATMQLVEGLLAGADAAKSACHRDRAGMTPLTWALRLRLPAVAKALMRDYQPDHRTDTFGMNALHWAARAGDTYVARRLLQYGFLPFKPSRMGTDAVMEAVQSRNPETVRVLISNINYTSPRNAMGDTAMHIAVAFRDVEMTKCLLGLGVGFGHADVEGRTPLFRALEAGEEGREVWRALLAAGAYRLQSGRTDARGRTLLHAAAEGGDEHAVRVLLSCGASHRAVDQDGESPLGCALRNGHRGAANAILQDREPPLLREDSLGRTPLHWAASAGWGHEARRLLAPGTDLQQWDSHGNSPILTAAAHGHWALAHDMFEWSPPRERSLPPVFRERERRAPRGRRARRGGGSV